MKKPWYQRIMNQEYDDSYDDRETGCPSFDQICREAKKWFEGFCKNQGYTNFEFRKGYFNFHGYFKVGEQWWYFSTADLRFKVLETLLVRTAQDNKDYVGGRNNFLGYDKLETDLQALLEGS
jgi:hypothetical protein